MRARTLGVAFGLICWTSSAWAVADEVKPAVSTGSLASDGVRNGTFLPLTLSANVGTAAVVASAYGGYDSARGHAIANPMAEARLWGPLALRAGAEYTGDRNGTGPTVGLRAQLLRQSAHGVDGAVGVFYRPEGFTELEGEVETTLSVARHFARVSLIGNVTYGQDPEGNERDGEVRLACQRHWSRLALGVDSRLRFAIGGANAAAEPKLDLQAAPAVAVAVGPIAFFGEAGPSIVTLSNSRTSVGVVVVSGVGAVF